MDRQYILDLFAAFERSGDRPEAAACALRVVRALPQTAPDDLRALREQALAAMDRLSRAKDAESAFRLGLLVMLLAALPSEREIAERQCPRCRRRALQLHVLRRPLHRFERRVCTRCRDRHATEGWQTVLTEDFHMRCRTCAQIMKPMHIIALVPSPLEAVACDGCAAELGVLGWRAAVTRSFI